LMGTELGCVRKERVLGAEAEVIEDETDEVEAIEAGVGTGGAKKDLEIRDPPPPKRKVGTGVDPLILQEMETRTWTEEAEARKKEEDKDQTLLMKEAEAGLTTEQGTLMEAGRHLEHQKRAEAAVGAGLMICQGKKEAMEDMTQEAPEEVGVRGTKGRCK